MMTDSNFRIFRVRIPDAIPVRSLLVGVLLGMLVACGGGSGPTSSGSGSDAGIEDKINASISDPQLANCAVTNIHDQGWTSESQVTSLKCEIANFDARIQSLAGIEMFQNLEQLWIYPSQEFLFELFGNPHLQVEMLDDVSPLLELPKLKDVLLYFQNVSDLQVPSTCQWTEIEVGGNPLRDISAISACKDLVYLGLDHTAVTDITPIKDLASLETLYMIGLQLPDLDPLANKPALRSLDISGVSINGSESVVEIPDFFADYSNLEYLFADYLALDGMENLAGNPLVRFSNQNGRLDMNDLLPFHDSLAILELSEATVSGMPATSALSRLEVLDLGRADITEDDRYLWSVLNGLGNLRHLMLDYQELNNLEALGGLQSLEYISLDATDLYSLLPLANLPELQTVDLGVNGVWNTDVDSDKNSCDLVNELRNEAPELEFAGDGC